MSFEIKADQVSEESLQQFRYALRDARYEKKEQSQKTELKVKRQIPQNDLQWKGDEQQGAVVEKLKTSSHSTSQRGSS